MRKNYFKLFGVLIAIIMIVGCAGVKLPPAQSVTLQIVAQRVGYYVAKKNPEIVPQAKLVALGITASQDPELMKVALNLAIKELLKQFPADPLLASDVNLILSSLQISQPNTKLNLEEVIPIINAFVNGMDVAVASK